MAASSKFDMLSGSPDRLTFPSGQRGAYTAASLDRLGSFREGIENRIQSSRPIMPRSGPTFLQGDVTNFLHSLPLDTRLMTAGQKFPRQLGVNRVLTTALGISSDDSQFAPSTSKLISPSLEGIKRFKNGVHDSAMRASDQVKIWGESISKFDKHFPSVWSRKRPRSDVQSSDRLNTSLAGDRLVLGGIASKLATQSHLTSCGFDYEQQKLEEQTKNGASNKRVRTSMVDVQVDNALGRPSGVMDREREMFGLANGPIQSEEKDQKLSIVMDGWEKSKLRKKRSGIKSDISASAVLVKPSEGDRESKRDIQQRLGIDARSRLSNIHGFRSGPSSGAVGVGKSDVTSQQTGLGMRLTPKNDPDNGSLLNDRRDRLTGSDKEKLNPKTNNNPLISRLNIHESSSSASPTSTTKMITSARAPRSGSGAIPKSSPSVHRSIGVPDDWEPSQSTNKLHSVVGANNRKRTQSTRSSSPPVVQWAGQRPQKITRVARRTNYVPLLSGNDEGPTTDTLSNVAGNDNGVGLKRSSGNALGQVKLKSDYLSSATLSESEESGAVEIKSKDKGKKSGEIDEKARLNVQKVSNLVLSSRKNKINDEDLGDGVRRQGRTVRGFTSGRPGVTIAVEKLDKAGTAKQLRSARLGSQKVESKPGRPPTRKLSDRKAYTRPRHAVNGGTQDTHGESHNVLEELLAAVKAAVNTGRACSSSLWTQMEPLFGFISAEQITYLKQQIYLMGDSLVNIQVTSNIVSNLKINHGYSFFTQTRGAICGSDCSTVTNRFELVECKRDVSIASEAKCVEHFSEQSVSGRRVQNVIPLCQRLIAALVSEENEGFCYNEDEDINFDVYGTRFELDTELKPNILNQQSSGNFQAVGKISSNGYTVPYTQRYHNGMDHDELDLVAVPNSGMISNLGRPRNGLQANQELTPNMSCTDFQYNQMSMDERVLLEIQSIGIFPEQPDLAQNEDEEIGEDIHRLEEKLHQQVAKKKTLLSTLEKSVTEARELQEREIERCAYDKLVLMTFKRYMTCWGPNASCGKGASGKVAKQAALASVKQTLDRCQKFEAFRESCFNEPVFQDVFRSVSSHFRAAESLDKITEGESTYLYAGTPTRSSEVRDSVNHVSAQNMDTLDNCYSDGFQSVNHVLEESSKVVTLSNKVKKRELLLDDVAGGTVGTSRAPSGIGSSLLSGGKGKRSERDREGKSHNRELPSRSGTPKIGRPALGNAKGERKTKTKPKQKTTQLSASVNGLHARASELPKSVPPSVLKSSGTTMDIKTKKKDEFSLDTFNDSEPLDLSHLQIPGIDVLGGPDDLDGQEQDLGSWLNIDDVGFQDDDIMGLEIPMDDLSDLKMML